jgi:hypothetical protein
MEKHEEYGQGLVRSYIRESAISPPREQTHNRSSQIKIKGKLTSTRRIGCKI